MSARSRAGGDGGGEHAPRVKKKKRKKDKEKKKKDKKKGKKRKRDRKRKNAPIDCDEQVNKASRLGRSAQHAQLVRRLSWSVRQGELSALQRFSMGSDRGAAVARSAGPGLPVSERTEFLSRARDAQGLSLLDHACQSGRVAVAKWLVSRGANVRTPAPHGEFRGWTPLHHACGFRRALVAEWLIAETDAVKDRGVAARVGEGAGVGVTPDDMGLGSLLAGAGAARMRQNLLKKSLFAEAKAEKQAELRAQQDREWRMKLQRAGDADRADAMGCAGADSTRDFDDDSDNMNHDEWADFIRMQHDAAARARRGGRPDPTKTEPTKPKRRRRVPQGATPPPFAWDDRKAASAKPGDAATTARQTPLEVFALYEDRFEEFKKSADAAPERPVRLADIPFPPSDSQYFDGVEAAARAAGDRARRVIRTLFLRWHPDKFLSRFRTRVDESELETVTRAVTEVQQGLVAVKDKIGV